MTDQDLNQIRTLIREALDGAVVSIGTEMSTRFGEVNARLDRIDATLTDMEKEIAVGVHKLENWRNV